MSGTHSKFSNVAKPYAKALFDVALDDKVVDQVKDDLDRFVTLVDGSDDLKRLVMSPVFSSEDQKGALKGILDKLNVHQLTSNFIFLLVQNRRLFAVSSVVSHYAALVSEHKGEVVAEVMSAFEMSDKQMKAITAALTEKVGKAVSVETKVDPSIIGGLVVKVGSRMIDTSLKTKLNAMKNAMKEAG